MAGTIPLSLTQQFDVYGAPLAGGQLYIIQVGTVSTPQNAYQDTGLSIALPYPITLDAAGRVPQFFLADGSVKIRLQDRYGVVQLASDSVLVIGPSAGGGGGSTVDPTQLIQTGMMMFAHSTASIAGFVRLGGRTIGSSTSGATERASADTQALFLYLWPDTGLTVSGGRGGSAAADWAANKQLSLPDWRGYNIGALDDMGNTASGRISSMGAAATTLGGVFGAQTYTMLLANLPPYTPAGTVGAAAHGTVNLPYNGSAGYAAGGGIVAYQRSSPNANDATNVPITFDSTSFAGTAQGGSSTAFNLLDPRKNITFSILNCDRNMSKIKYLYDVTKLAKVFRYDPVTGILYRRSLAGRERVCGTLFNTGHMQVSFQGNMIGVHRIAWALQTGKYPTVEIDHINGDGADNRFCNLRLATSRENNQNRRLSTRNKTGIKGVFRVKKGKPWRVAIGRDDQYYITHFICFGQAVKHANDMRAKFHHQFARTS